MRNLVCVPLILCFCVSMAWGVEGVVDRENLSLKAGPTEPGEGLSLVWVEALVYPKAVKEEKVISLGVRTASKVKQVKATFDFSSDPVVLSSSDGLSWSSAYKIPEGMAEGVHVARYQIAGRKGSIQRTVEFFVEKADGNVTVAENVSRGEAVQTSGWPLTVISSCTAFAGNASRSLRAGQKLTGLSKTSWYKVLFDDGKEGWVLATQVKEPTEDYYYLGYRAYQNKDYSTAIRNYREAVAVDPGFLKGHLWLAKSYLAQGNLDSASKSIQKALRLDERNVDSRVVAAVLAQRCFSLAHEKYKSGRYHEAVAAFRKVLDLKPDSVLSWMEMGESLRQLGLESEAHDAWKEGAVLRTRFDAGQIQVRAATVAPLVADDSLRILREEKTGKGTKIEAAIRSVVSLTKSLGTPIIEKGWQIRKQGEKSLVSYLCEQSGGALESFDWLVDVDTRQVLPHNDNARILMSRW